MKSVLRSQASSRGFTLLEMLVVMVLLSIIMLSMVSALRSAGQSSERVDARLMQLDDERIAENFLRNTLGRISARPLPIAVEGLPRAPVLFSGGPDQISWVGVLPARYGAGGRSFLNLAVEPGAQGASLVVRFIPWEDQNEFPNWGGATPQVLLSNITAFSVQYENDRPMSVDASSEWESSWSHQDYVPTRAVISIERTARPPIQWVVPMWPLPLSTPSGLRSGGPVIGGGGD